MKVGWDFDGVLNRLPQPYASFIKNYSHDDIFSRSGLTWLKLLFIYVFARTPFILNGRVFDVINWKNENYVISGRVIKQKEAIELLRRFPFKGIFFRKPHEKETPFKIRKAKELDVDLFFEDRLYVVARLWANGITAVIWDKTYKPEPHINE